MKTLFLFIFSTALICGFVVLANAGIFTDVIAHFKTSTSMDAGNIPWTAVIILLAAGIVGILGIRRRGKKS